MHTEDQQRTKGPSFLRHREAFSNRCCEYDSSAGCLPAGLGELEKVVGRGGERRGRVMREERVERGRNGDAKENEMKEIGNGR